MRVNTQQRRSRRNEDIVCKIYVEATLIYRAKPDETFIESNQWRGLLHED